MWTALLLGLTLQGQLEPALSVLSPGTRYDAAIPTLEDAIGHDFGDELSTHHQIVQYLGALHDAAPDRARLIEYAKSWEPSA